VRNDSSPLWATGFPQGSMARPRMVTTMLALCREEWHWVGTTVCPAVGDPRVEMGLTPCCPFMLMTRYV
jgi:hypothetical protein